MRENTDAKAQDDEHLVRSYARSHLKQLYDEVVVDDSRGIGGFLWKFPSEGSNNTTITISDSKTISRRHKELVFPLGAAVASNAQAAAEPAYPRKCAKCLSAWVSDRSSERRHRKTCTSRKSKEKRSEDDGDAEDAADTKGVLVPPLAPVSVPVVSPLVSKLGVARRVWCEVDSTLSRLQWREDIESEQDASSCSIPFLEILDVALLDEPANSFQIVTSAPRTVVFQSRPGQEELEQQEFQGEDRALIAEAQRPRSMDAEQWCEYLDVFSQYARQQSAHNKSIGSNQQHSPTAAYESHTFHNSDMGFFDELVFARITRAIINEDVEVLEALIKSTANGGDQDGQEEEPNRTHLMRDEGGSSLLIVALKLGAGPRIIQILLDAGVDCNAKNNDEESPLLLVAASGDDEMLQLLLAQANNTVDVNQRCSLGATAFHAAANAGDLKILEMLCEAGALTSAVDSNGWTALHYVAACPTGVDAMHFLCELVPELLDCQCQNGNTALHVASGYGCVENVRALLQTAANPHILNAEDHTAYHVALHSNKIQCAVAINEYMANSQELYAAAATGSSSRLEDEAQGEQLMKSFRHAKKIDSYRAAATSKEDFVSPPAIVQLSQSAAAEHFPRAWVEYATPDGLPYYYNTSTGASSWHRPQLPQFYTDERQQERDIFGHVWDDHQTFDDDALAGESVDGAGHELPLCLIPMVSLLVSLDDPTAAYKIESQRRKAREKRRANLRRHHRDHHDQQLLFPSSPPSTS